MRIFSDWLLLEREFDRSMRMAAGSAFDKFTKNLIVILRNSVEVYAKEMAENKVRQYNLDSVRTEQVELAHIIMRTGSFQSGSKAWLSADIYNRALVLNYNIREESQIVLPPNIRMKDFRKYLVNSIGLFTIVLKGAGGNWGGEYLTGRKNGSFSIALYGMPSMTTEDHMAFSQAVQKAIAAKMAGKTAKAIVRPLNAWVDAVQGDMLARREIFVHEYMHFLDDIRYKSADTAPGNIAPGIRSAHDPSDITKKAYFTSDAEWNSYFQGASSVLEDAIESFLVATTNEYAVKRAVELMGGKHATFNALTARDRCIRVADAVVNDFYRRVGMENGESWIEKHFETVGIGSGFTGLYRFCLALISYNAYSTSMFFLEDPKQRKRLFSRVASFVQDAEKAIREYKARMASGKVPTVQEFNKAKAKYMNKTTTKLRDPYGILYSGMMMGKKPFDPKKQYTEI